MCGICGFGSFRDDNLIRKMTDSLSYRGPDGTGYHITDDVSLGMTRLAIIDLSTGSQPVYNEDKTIAVVFNGEIYNFGELRGALESKGHRFYTKTDTEVIVHLYEEHGENFCTFLRGMFAIALWDERKKQLLLVRDHIGIKPLHYAEYGGKIIFGSEIKAILQCAGMVTEIDANSLNTYLHYLYIPAPDTIYKQIKKLMPGHYLIWKNRRSEIRQYWELQNMEPVNIPEEELKNRLFDLLKSAVKEQMASDVPIGAFLSGGLDSSSIIAMMSGANASGRVKTFSVGYGAKDKSFNEFDKSRLVAGLFNCEHHEETLQPDISGMLPEIVRHFDEPFADSSAVPTYLVSKVSRPKVKVALTGIGGDEVFGGYPRYLGAKLFVDYEKIPFALRRLFKSLAPVFPETGKSRDWSGRIKRFLRSGTKTLPDSYREWVNYLNPEMEKEIYIPQIKELMQPPATDKYFKMLENNELQKLLNVDIKTYLPGDILCMSDRMSMANSLELRVPLCDIRLIEFFSRIPFSYRVRGLTLKYLLKRIMEGILPEEILSQKKMGFMMPLTRWTREELRPVIEEYLSESSIKRRGYFRPRAISAILRQHFNNEKNYSDIIWALLILELWHRECAEKVTPPPVFPAIPEKKIKILMVTDIIPVDEEGGSGRVVWELSKKLTVKGHKVIVLTKNKPGLMSEKNIDGIDVQRCKANILDFYSHADRIIKERGISLVCTNHPFSALGAVLASKKRKVPVIHTFYSPWPEEFGIRSKDLKRSAFSDFTGKLARKILEKTVVSMAGRTVVLSEFMADRLNKWYGNKIKKPEIVYGGIDLEKFVPPADKAEVRRRLSLPENAFIILTVRNLVSRMGLENLIISMKKTAEEFNNAYLVIGGRGYLESNLRKLAAELGLDGRILFTGYIPEDKLVAYYQAADVFVLPTRELEGFGLITLEAMACGTPVLATSVGANVEVLGKFDRNFLFAGAQSEDIADGVKKFILEGKNDPGLAGRCRKYVEDNYSWDSFAQKMEEIYEQIKR